MASQVARARIAAIALVVAVAFVIVGFVRVDREMIRVDNDRAVVMLSESGTQVEVFLLRELAQLRSIEQLIQAHSSGLSFAGDSLHIGDAEMPRWTTPFDELWVIDSASHVQVIAANPSNENVTLDTVTVLDLVRRRPTRDPTAFVSGSEQRRRLVFVESLRGQTRNVVVGTVATDSVAAMLKQQQRPMPARLVVKALADTVVDILTPMPNAGLRTLQRSIVTPFADTWTISETYAPPSRGARIALWVVGLGAILGLGIGLLLEQRETSRIADRSSELEHLSGELLRANRAKSEFLANVSHELRTPLNAIVGFVDLLRDGVYGPLNSRQSGPVERIEASANHLRHLVDQVLDLAKMAAGRLEVHAESVELRPFVFDVVSEVEPLMTEKGLSFSLAVGATLPRVRTDPTHLRQILINLLGNAVKFTANGGISVRGKLIQRTDHPTNTTGRTTPIDLLTALPKATMPWIALQVADSGIGIPEKDRDRIFDEFEQVNAGPRGDSMRRGTGLGLSISRRLARLLGGDITVESELGRGSVFTVWLPVDPGDLRGDRAA